MINLKDRGIESELRFFSSRGSGPGGQNVNKVNTKVELRCNIKESLLLTPEEKNILLQKLENKVTSYGELIVVAQEDRSQLRNRQKATERFFEWVQKALTPRKKRKKTVPTQASIEKRLRLKKIAGQKKELRRNNTGHL